ncbi:hypothetical protein K488DRAFT_8301, partial [Vararia minispora EC-137]
PILDSSLDESGLRSQSGCIPGLRPFLEAVTRDMDVLSRFLAHPYLVQLSPLSTNSPYLISVWKEVLTAPAPVTSIGKTFYEGGPARVRQPKVQGGQASRSNGVKVDVVADGGRSWIRVNTTKNSRLLAELREIDSYATDSDTDVESPVFDRPSLCEKEFSNSILRAGRALLTAAQANPIASKEGPITPTVTLRLTRLDPTRDDEPRIGLTVDMLRKMGLSVQLGGREDVTFPSAEDPSSPDTSSSPLLVPTLRLNLDLSLLIALITDLTHAPLPLSPEDAVARFVPSASYVEWKRKRTLAKRAAEGDDKYNFEDDADLINHSRALVEQAQQEIQRGLLDEIHLRLSSALGGRTPTSSEGVEFWTTSEARARCLRIVDKIGGPQERRRVHALFPDPDISVEQTQAAYWQDSRYPINYVPLLPLHICDSPILASSFTPTAPFAAALETTCRSLLADGLVLPKSLTPPPASPAFGDEIGRATVTRLNPKLTAHTVQSMLWGAARGCTTMTANRGSVRALLREMQDRSVLPAAELCEGAGEGRQEVQHAVIWMVDPRSLAEGMRSDF